VSPGSRSTLPVTVIATVDAVLRDVAAMSVLADVPGVVSLRYDLHPGRATGSGAGSPQEGGGALHRVVSDATGVLEDAVLPLRHSCLSCALREDLLPTLVRLAGAGRWSALALALPVAGEPLPVVRGVATGEVDGAPVADHVHVSGVVAVVDATRVVGDLLGLDDGPGDGPEDGPGDSPGDGDGGTGAADLAEALSHQLRAADLVLTTGLASDGASRGDDEVVEQAVALLRHLVPAPRLRLAGPGDVLGAELVADRHDPERSWRREDPRCAEPTGAVDEHGVWTLDLRSWRPVHPRRLQQELEELASGWLLGWGRFWLPTRPDVVGIWEGVGGRLSLGDAGDWEGASPSTRLVVTGVDESPERVAQAFARALMTDAELAAGLDRWVGREDGFDEWMGQRSGAA